MDTLDTPEAQAGLLDDCLTEEEFAGEIGKCTATVQRWRLSGKGPVYTMIGRTPLITRKNARKWLESLEKGLTND